MNAIINTIKGIHPGIYLDRELKARKLSKGPFALSIGAYPQTLGAITKAKRKMNIPLSLKIEQALGLEEGFLMMLQLYYDIELEKRNQIIPPKLKNFNKTIFWDVSIDDIDWNKHKKFVIDRVMERGSEYEKKIIKEYYNL